MPHRLFASPDFKTPSDFPNKFCSSAFQYCHQSSARKLKHSRTETNMHDYQLYDSQQMNDIRSSASLSGHSPTSTDDNDSTVTYSTQHSPPPGASLLGSPRELRDQIYGYLAETEERIVLGWRFVRAHRSRDTIKTLDECFDLAVALNPLSMTCKQMRAEFQNVHFTARNARWTLLVNNFDLEQLHLFYEYIVSGSFIMPRDWATTANASLYAPGTTYPYSCVFRWTAKLFPRPRNCTTSNRQITRKTLAPFPLWKDVPICMRSSRLITALELLLLHRTAHET
jgi:hypothetical protein